MNFIFLLITVAPVSIRFNDGIVFFPQPSFYSAPFEPPNVFTVMCNGLDSHGNLQWTTDYEGFDSDLSLLSPANGSVNSTGPNELTLTLTDDGYSYAAGNFTCTSLDSGLSASVYLPGCEYIA